MKIGLVTAEYPPMQGGVGDFTRAAARALVALGHEVHVVTNLKSQTPALPTGSLWLRAGASDSNFKAEDDGVRVERVIDGWGWSCWRALSDVSQRLGLVVVNIQYQAAAYRMHPAINLLPLARRLPFVRWPHVLPIVVTFHDLKVPYLFPKAGPLRRQAVLALARYADAAIVTNAEDALELGTEIPNPLKREIPKSKITRIPIGSNITPCLPSGYDRSEWRWRWGVKPDETLIGYFGFLHPLKGGEVLVRALAELAAEGRPVKLLHIGGRTGSSDPDTNAAYAARVESLSRKLKVADRMAATGYMPPDQVAASFFATDVFALPYTEGASLRHGTFHAALAHGRAIVTTYPSIPLNELRDGENILLVPPNDAHALADGIRRVIGDPALRTRLERGACELAQQFTWDRIAARTAEVYERVIRELQVR
jgi:glycosyltransferase involved in cell wall biosynthesis